MSVCGASTTTATCRRATPSRRAHLYIPRGLTLDPKKKTVIVSDKLKNSVMTFSLPELYDRPASQTARAAN